MTATANVFRKALTTNSTSTGFTAKIPTATAPVHSAANGVYDLFNADYGQVVGIFGPKFIQLVPFATNGNNDTFNMRLWGWNKTNDATPLYIPQMLCELNIVLGNIDGAAVASTTVFADTITLAKGDTTSPIINTANDTPASILIHVRGCRWLEFDWDLAGAQEADSMNTYYRFMDQ